jgi:hypothetical protein
MPSYERLFFPEMRSKGRNSREETSLTIAVVIFESVGVAVPGAYSAVSEKRKSLFDLLLELVGFMGHEVTGIEGAHVSTWSLPDFLFHTSIRAHAASSFPKPGP